MAFSQRAITQCYVAHLGIVDPSSQVPCGSINNGVQPCCFEGETCLDHSICHFFHPQKNGSDYYTAGCTDASFKAAECAQQCGRFTRSVALSILLMWLHIAPFATQDITYNNETGLWACCYGSEGFNCAVPGHTTIEAPAPEDLEVFNRSHYSSRLLDLQRH